MHFDLIHITDLFSLHILESSRYNLALLQLVHQDIAGVQYFNFFTILPNFTTNVINIIYSGLEDYSIASPIVLYRLLVLGFSGLLVHIYECILSII